MAAIFNQTLWNDNDTSINVTSSYPTNVWEMPVPAMIIAVVFLATNLAIGLSANCLLIIIINYSPTLKTPANSHLINICANNLLLCLCMALSLVSLLLPSNVNGKINILTGFHVFLESNCLLQYWGTFASIGFYRSKIIHCPSVSVKRRRQIISRCLTTSWVVSLVVSLMVCLSHLEDDEYACLTLNPFQRTFILCLDNQTASVQRITIISIKAIVFCTIFVVIVVSYYKVFKSLRNGRTFGKNRVFPTSRSLSLPSEIGDIQGPNITNFNGDPSIFEKTPYTVSGNVQNTENDFVVHYQRNGAINVLSFEDIIALENPILASNLKRQGQQKRALQLTRSNASNTSVKSKCPDFTDISAGGDLKRYRNMTNNAALRNHFLKRDRVGFNSATRNSLVMLASFIVCSFPMFICTIPYVLSKNRENHRVLILLFTKLIFYLNAPIYPLWYLIQNRRVRRCLARVIETVLMKADLRR